MRHLLLAFVVLLSLPVVAVAQPMIQSQEGIALENQILQLQQQLQQVQAGGGAVVGGGSGYAAPPDQGNGSGGPDSSILSNLLNQVQQLQAQVQQLSGRVDTLQNQVNTQHDATEKEIGDLKFQVGGGAGGAGAGAPAGPAQGQPGDQGVADEVQPDVPVAPPPAPPPPPVTVPATPHARLRAAQAALAKHDYAAAEQNARAVLSSAKTSPDGYQAQYLLAQTLAGEGRPQDAAIAYDDEYNRSRTGTNAPGALLGLANSLTAIHQAAAACDTLASLNSQFPSPPAGMQARITAASRRAHCN